MYESEQRCMALKWLNKKKKEKRNQQYQIAPNAMRRLCPKKGHSNVPQKPPVKYMETVAARASAQIKFNLITRFWISFPFISAAFASSNVFRVSGETRVPDNPRNARDNSPGIDEMSGTQVPCFRLC